jgi:GGDEF domain-containing protein
MRRRFSYALTAGVLSSGAPAGLLGIRLARRDDEISLRRVSKEIAADRAAYMYIGGATALIFALFGYILGRHADDLAELSETDALTQLLNARGFASRLCAEIRRTRRYREPLSVLFLDVDGLKNIKIGTGIGPEAIIAPGGRRDRAGYGDRYRRALGGDEFLSRRTRSVRKPCSSRNAFESVRP